MNRIDESMPRRSSALKRGVVSWAWMLEKQERPLTPEEEEQCRRSRHSSRGTGVSSRRGP